MIPFLLPVFLLFSFLFLLGLLSANLRRLCCHILQLIHHPPPSETPWSQICLPERDLWPFILHLLLEGMELISTSAMNPLYWPFGHKWSLQCLWRSSGLALAATPRSSSHLAATSLRVYVAIRCAMSAARTSETAKAIATSASISDPMAGEAAPNARSAISTDVKTTKWSSRKPKKRLRDSGWRRKATSSAAMRRFEKSWRKNGKMMGSGGMSGGSSGRCQIGSRSLTR
jgi:hypothetical protein